MNTYDNIKKLYPSFNLTNILKSIEQTHLQQIPHEAEDIYKLFMDDVFLLTQDESGRFLLATVKELQSPYLVKISDTNIQCSNVGQQLRYICYELHPDVYYALRMIYARENCLSFPFFNSYVSEYWHVDGMEHHIEDIEDILQRILSIKYDFNMDDIYRKIGLIHSHSNSTLSFQIPNAINKVKFNGTVILFETDEGDVQYPCNRDTYLICISNLMLRSSGLIPNMENLGTLYSTYKI
jgi:hypothetical protein